MKRMLRLALAAALIFTLMLPVAAPALADSGFSVTLEKAGEVSAEDFSVTFGAAGLRRQGEADGYANYSILDWQGNAASGPYDKLDVVQNCFVVYDASSYPNYCGLVKSDGTVLIPAGTCASIKAVSGGDRYLEVVYATDRVENEEDAFIFFYQKSSQYEISINRTPEDGDDLFDGYVRIYDLREEQFIDGLEVTNPAESFKQIGDNIFLSNRKKDIYRPDGTLVGTAPGSIVSNRYFSEKITGDTTTYLIYDENLDVAAELDYFPYGIFGDLDVIVKQEKTDDGSYYTLVDSEGNPLNSEKYPYNLNACGKYFISARNEDSYYTLVDLSGSTIIPFSEKATYISTHSYGGFVTAKGEDWNGLVYPDGTFVKLADDEFSGSISSSNFLIKEPTDDGVDVFVLDKEDFSLKLHSVEAISNGIPIIISDRNPESKDYALYSVSDGSQLLDYKYSKFGYAAGYLYAKIGDVWEIYAISID